MKKVIFTFMAVVSIFNAKAQQRTILYEEFTGENCGPCAAANPGLEALMATNTGKILHVTFMEPVPTSGFFYTSVQALNDARYGCATAGYYNPIWASMGSCFTPSGFMDGHLPDSSTGAPCGNCGNVASFKQADIDNEYPKPSPFNITATHHFNAAHDSVFGKVVIHAVSAIGGNSLKLRAAFVKSMNFVSPPGSNGESHFENVARTMFPSASGQSIATSWAVGTTNTYNYSGKIAHLDALTGVTTVDSNFIVWVQNDTAGGTPASRFSVLQAAKSTYTTTTGVANVNGTNPSVNLNLYPNPANETSTLSFTLEQATDVNVKVMDQLGRVVKSVADQHMTEGTQNIIIDTKTFATGIYSVIVQIDGEVYTQKLSVIK